MDGTDDASLRRPRMSPQRLLEMHSAAMDVLREVGYEDFSMDLVASRARCSKATLYRHWSGKAHLVADAVRLCKAAEAASRIVSVIGDPIGGGRLNQKVFRVNAGVNVDGCRLARGSGIAREGSQASENDGDERCPPHATSPFANS